MRGIRHIPACEGVSGDAKNERSTLSNQLSAPCSLGFEHCGSLASDTTRCPHHIRTSISSPNRVGHPHGAGQRPAGAGTGRRHRARGESEVDSASGPSRLTREYGGAVGMVPATPSACRPSARRRSRRRTTWRAAPGLAARIGICVMATDPADFRHPKRSRQCARRPASSHRPARRGRGARGVPAASAPDCECYGKM